MNVRIVTSALIAVVLSGGIAAAADTDPDATAGTPIIVSQAGDGDHETIGAAIAAARDGDTILIGPGTYVEQLLIEDDITLAGHAPVDEVVVTAPEQSIIALVGSDAALSGFTLHGPQTSGVRIRGGAPSLSGLVFDSVGLAETPPDTCRVACSALVLTEGTRARIVGNSFDRSGAIIVHGQATPVILGNDFQGSNGVSLIEAGEDVTVSGNTFSDAVRFGIGIFGPGRPLIEGNIIEGASEQGIIVGPPLYDSVSAILRDNTISSSRAGIVLIDADDPLVAGNTLIDNGVGISTARADARIKDNRISGGEHGLWLDDASVVSDSRVSRAGVGIYVASGARPTLLRTRVCDNAVNLEIGPDAEPTIKKRKRFICADDS